jgi:hypothetical protein
MSGVRVDSAGTASPEAAASLGLARVVPSSQGVRPRAPRGPSGRRASAPVELPFRFEPVVEIPAGRPAT